MLWGLVKLVKGIKAVMRARRGGWIVYGDEQGRIRSEGVWVRESEGWSKWWRRMRGRECEDEVLVVDGESEEGRPLLG